LVEQFPYKMVNPDFFEMGPGGPMVVGSKCRHCGRVYFPKKTICVDCWKRGEMDTVPLSRRGKLSLYTVATQSLLGLDTPYACGYVDLPEGVRLFALLTDCQPFDQKLSLDMEVEMVIEKMMTNDFGEDIHTYKFRPATNTR
jgi:uncharacterized OB-fold protein